MGGVRRTLVTGATGFLGPVLVRRLVEQGELLCVLSRTGSESAIERMLAFARPRADQIVVRFSAEETARAETLHTVYHLAGSRVIGASAEARAANLETNVGPLRRILELLGPQPIDAFVYASTGAVYGRLPVPFREQQQELEPETAYGAAKLAGEQVGRAALPGLIAARMSVLYGPNQPPTMFIPELIRAAALGKPFAMSPGEQRRDFLFVDDAAEALVKLAATPAARGHAVNVGAGSSVVLRQLAVRILELMGNPTTLLVGAIPYRDGEAMDYELSTERITQWTGWRPLTSLDEGLRRTIAAARQPSRVSA